MFSGEEPEDDVDLCFLCEQSVAGFGSLPGATTPDAQSLLAQHLLVERRLHEARTRVDELEKLSSKLRSRISTEIDDAVPACKLPRVTQYSAQN